MPEGRLLVYDESIDTGGAYHVIDFPDMSVTPYAPLSTDQPKSDSSWAFSPGSRYLAFDRENFDTSDNMLLVLDTQTETLTEIGDYAPSNNGPTWTADGSLLEFDVYDQGLYIYDVGAGGLRHLSVTTEFSDYSAISPAGDQIVFMGECPDPDYTGVCAMELFLINADGTNERFLLRIDVGEQIEDVAWHPRGKGIYYSVFAHGSYYFDLETATPTLISNESAYTDFKPSLISPQGDFLAYVSGSSFVYLVDTSDNTQAFVPITGSMPFWTSDGRYIVVIGLTEPKWTIFDVETGASVEFDPHLSASTQIVGWLP